eukprot:1488919-Rhodomonas_salina.1
MMMTLFDKAIAHVVPGFAVMVFPLPLRRETSLYASSSLCSNPEDQAYPYVDGLQLWHCMSVLLRDQGRGKGAHKVHDRRQQ